MLRDNVVIHDGELDSLKRFKDDVREVKAGFECGMSLKSFNDVKVGDQFEVFEVVEVARTSREARARRTIHRGSRPQRRIGDQIQRELSELLQRELRDPRVGHVTLTGVEVSPDLSHAKVFFTMLEPAGTCEEAAQGPEARRRLPALAARPAHQAATPRPELRFEYDESVERGDRLRA